MLHRLLVTGARGQTLENAWRDEQRGGSPWKRNVSEHVLVLCPVVYRFVFIDID